MGVIEHLNNTDDDITPLIGPMMVLIGFVIYAITFFIFALKPPFNYFSKPNVWFVISIVIMACGFYHWFKIIIRECGGE